MKENNFDKEILRIIGETIFNKSCLERKYTSMYSELTNKLVSAEAKQILSQ